MVSYKNIILIVGLIIFVPSLYASDDGSGPTVGEPTHTLYGRTLGNELYSLKKDLGRIKVINFFWIECIPCREEMPELARLEREFTGVKFISVHTSLFKPTEEPESVANFIKSLKAAPSNIVLTTSKELGNLFNLTGLPHTIVLDENNIVLMNVAGYNIKNIQNLEISLKHITKN